MNPWNAINLLSLVSFVVNLVLGSVILARDPGRALNRIYAFITFILAWWAVTKLATGFASDAATAALTFRMSAPAWCLLTGLWLHFVLEFTGTIGRRPVRILVALCHLAGMSLAVLVWVPGAMMERMELTRWGYEDVPGPLYRFVFQPYLITGFVAGILLLARHVRRVGAHEEKRQAQLVLAGIGIPLAGGVVTNMVLPSLGIFVIELAVPLTTLNAIVVAWAIHRYRFLSITVEHAASTIISTTGYSLVVLAPDGTIRLVKPATLELLGRMEADLAGRHVDTVLVGTSFTREFAASIEREGTRKVEIQVVDGRDRRIPVIMSISVLRAARGEVLGYVCVGKDIREQRALMERIEAARRELETLAQTDPLTGLHNRRYLTIKVREEMLRSQRYKHPFSVVIVDLDGFKEVNDELGHDQGDLVLVAVADEIRKQVRSTDTVSRWGGDEFVLLLSETGRQQALLLAERIRNAIDSVSPKAGEAGVTASIGVSTYTPDDQPRAELELFKLADWALLSAKRTGKNRVVHSDALP